MSVKNIEPGLFGIKNSNRDYSNPDTWGKNQFNSSFPAALACYLYSQKLSAVYLTANQDSSINKDYIGIDNLFGIAPLDKNTFFSFESQFSPYQRFIFGNMPRNDLVIMNKETGICLSNFEIKLTALPDNSTCNENEDCFGCEIVVRPDTIVYLACSIIKKFIKNPKQLKNILELPRIHNIDWSQGKFVLPHIWQIKNAIIKIVNEKYQTQSPIILQPIWKTEGKSPRLAQYCLDVFVWSDFGMLNLFLPDEKEEILSISRHTRSMIWLYKMLLDYSLHGGFDCTKIIDELSYNTKNDKAFSSNGKRTQPLMCCQELTKPRITKKEIKNIILGGGQNLLSPERRFDAIIYNSPELFD